jgi:hypothetical protein
VFDGLDEIALAELVHGTHLDVVFAEESGEAVVRGPG